MNVAKIQIDERSNDDEDDGDYLLLLAMTEKSEQPPLIFTIVNILIITSKYTGINILLYLFFSHIYF